MGALSESKVVRRALRSGRDDSLEVGYRPPPAHSNVSAPLHYWRWIKRLTLPVSFITVLAFGVPVLAVAVLINFAGVRWWDGADSLCRANGLGCDLSVHVIGTAIVAALSFALIFLRREAWAATRWSKRARQHPERLLERWLPPKGGVSGLAVRTPSVATAPELARAGDAAVHTAAATTAATAGVRPSEETAVTPLLERVLPRAQLVFDIADDLDERVGTQVLVGPTGSGKTIVLLSVAQEVARRGLYPIAFSLRDAPRARRVDFEAQARETYRRNFPKLSDEEADKQWRWLRRSGNVVLIIDDLEKTRARPYEVVQGLTEVGKRYRVLAASRRNGIPIEYRRGRIELQDLDRAAVVNDLAGLMERYSGLDAGAAQDAAQLITDAANIPRTPYFLAIARVLAQLGTLHQVPTTGIPRMNMLLEYRAALASGRLRLDAGLDVPMRGRVLDGLEWIAFARMNGRDKITEIEPWLHRLLETEYDACVGAPFDARQTVEYGKRLGLIDDKFDTTVRFGHPTTLAFFAACLLARRRHDERLWSRIYRAKGFGTEASLACVFAHGQVTEEALVARTCAALYALLGIQDERRVPREQRSLIVRTALEVAAVTGPERGAQLTSVVNDVVRAAADERRTAGLGRDQLELVHDVAALPIQSSDRTYESLWLFATDAGDYRVRREAAKLLRAAAEEDPDWLVARVSRVIDQAGGLLAGPWTALDDDREPPFPDLRVAALVLPSLRRCTGGETRERLDRRQHRIRELATRLTHQLGLEASIADGFKVDAMSHADLDPDPLACELLEPGDRRAAFWFSRVLLLQAVTRRCVAGDGHEHARALVAEARSDRHPFVRATARLCVQALTTGEWQPYVWQDMTEVVAGDDWAPGIEARQLAGEMTLLLNMNEHGAVGGRIDFGQQHGLPPCLVASRDRAEILGSRVREGCTFPSDDGCLCPYTCHPPDQGIRRELSQAFCRDQRHRAGSLDHSAISAKKLKRFWREMESLARF